MRSRRGGRTCISWSRVWRTFKETDSGGTWLMLIWFLANWACRVFLQLSYLEGGTRPLEWALLNNPGCGDWTYLSSPSLLTSSSADACFLASLSAHALFVATGDSWNNVSPYSHRHTRMESALSVLVPQ